MTGRRICLLGKYPPIQGGVAVQTYWLAQALARRGHDVQVVTNAGQVEAAHRTSTVGLGARPCPGVTVHEVLPFVDMARWYIPQGRPDVTRLVGVCSTVARECDVVLSWYLEPYAVAGALVSALLGIPHVVRHAGSDLFDLATDPELGAAYREVLRACAGVISADPLVHGLGLSDEQLLGTPPAFIPQEWYVGDDRLDLDAVCAGLRAQGATVHTPPGGRASGHPLVGMYGKLAGPKGVTHLLMAAARLRQRGTPVQVALVGVSAEFGSELLKRFEGDDTADHLYLLPPLAPESMPAFVRTCRAVAYLEHDFGVTQHRSSPPSEVLAAGRPLLISQESLKMLPSSLDLHGVSASVVVTEPKHAARLADDLLHALSATPPVPGRPAWLGTEGAVVRWYETAIDRTLAPPTRQADSRLTSVRSALQRFCPTASLAWGDRLASAVESLAADGALGAFRFLSDRILMGEGDNLPAVAGQIVTVELEYLRAGLDGCLTGDGTPFTVPVVDARALSSGPPREEVERRPVCTRWSHVVTLDIDALDYLRAVVVTRSRTAAEWGPAVPSGVRRQPQAFAFYRGPNLTRRAAAISERLRALLDAADGMNTIGSLHVMIAPGVSGEEFAQLVRRLAAAELLAFARDPS